ncbi:hypothetical protein QT238_07585 [Geobacillus stearothermophilus]|nr:hypothetical protein GARCT_01972 [Geobacillus sp. 12AMOR1]WJQ15401.1 hypothetical protein QT238_07585 [Geobacillus stearothermophilus]
MRVIKLSDSVFGFDSLEGCKAYFRHVLPWSKYYFPIVGEGNRISKEKISVDETVLFIYKGNIVAIAKVENYEVDNNKVRSLKLRADTFKVFEETADIKELEQNLASNGYDLKIQQSQGWNIITEEHEQIVINFLIRHEWKSYLL